MGKSLVEERDTGCLNSVPSFYLPLLAPYIVTLCSRLHTVGLGPPFLDLMSWSGHRYGHLLRSVGPGVTRRRGFGDDRQVEVGDGISNLIMGEGRWMSHETQSVRNGRSSRTGCLPLSLLSM